MHDNFYRGIVIFIKAYVIPLQAYFSSVLGIQSVELQSTFTIESNLPTFYFNFPAAIMIESAANATNL